MVKNLKYYRNRYIYPVILSACVVFYATYFWQFWNELYMRFKLRHSHIVVSLSTTPYRINKIDRVLKSITDQNVGIDNIYLNVPYIFNRENIQYVIPESLKTNKNITIIRCEDYGPATKLLGLLHNKELPADTIIVTLDDDIYYPKNTVLHLAYAALNNPHAAVGLSGADLYGQHEIRTKKDQTLGFKTKYNFAGPVTILQGYAGIAYRAGFFAPDVFNIQNFPKSCINSDDLYFSFYLAQHNIPRLSIANRFMHTFKIDPDTETALGSDALQMQHPLPYEKHEMCLTYLKHNYPHVDFSNNLKSNILLITLPKSGSTYLTQMIKDNLGYSLNRISSIYHKETGYLMSNIKAFRGTNSIVFKEHFSAPYGTAEPYRIKVMGRLDVDSLRVNKQKMILHLRDPRQVLLSLYWHIEEDPEGGLIPYEVVEWYSSQTRTTKLDWMIENMLPILISWTENWVKFKDQEDRINNGLPILITTYDEMVADNEGLYAKILAFYNIERNYANFVAPDKNRKVRFRKGDAEEWRTTFSATQKQRIAELMPTSLLQRFGWSTNPD